MANFRFQPTHLRPRTHGWPWWCSFQEKYGYATPRTICCYSHLGVFIATLLLVLLCVEGGYQWARKKHRSEVEKEAPIGAMVGAVLGLFAFILAFTFGMAAERFHDRQLALLDETNAIRATWLQAGMIAEPYRT